MPWRIADRTKINFAGQPYLDEPIRVFCRPLLPRPLTPLQRQIRDAVFGEEMDYEIVGYLRQPFRWVGREAHDGMNHRT